MKRSSMSWTAAAAMLAVFALRATVAGQTAPSNQDTLAALLVEVRGLRAAMEQMVSAGPRVELAFGRLQMQEQRVNTLVRRAEGLRTQIAEAERSLIDLRGELTGFQHRLDNPMGPDETLMVQGLVTVRKQQLEQKTTDLGRLQAEEADTLSQVQTEQSRWTEINQRLEDLERTLAR